MKLIVEKKDGEKIRFLHQNIANQFFGNLKKGFYTIHVERYFEEKTDPQRAYYFGVVVQMIMWYFNYLGNEYDDKETNDFLCKKFLPTETQSIVNESTGELIDTITTQKRISKLNLVEMAKFIQDCIDWADSFLNLKIPTPQKGMQKADLQQYFITQIELQVLQ